MNEEEELNDLESDLYKPPPPPEESLRTTDSLELDHEALLADFTETVAAEKPELAEAIPTTEELSEPLDAPVREASSTPLKSPTRQPQPWQQSPTRRTSDSRRVYQTRQAQKVRSEMPRDDLRQLNEFSVAAAENALPPEAPHPSGMPPSRFNSMASRQNAATTGADTQWADFVEAFQRMNEANVGVIGMLSEICLDNAKRLREIEQNLQRGRD